MSEKFDQALDHVRVELERRAGGKHGKLRASWERLEALREPVAPEPKEDEPEASPDGQRPGTQEWQAFQEQVLACTKCAHLADSRTQVVFGVGNRSAELMFVGEAPGADEDRLGEPFVGRAGQLLTKIIQTMGFQREDVYIANVLKCRPDLPPGGKGNRPPTPEEMETCLPYLRKQMEWIQPTVVVALGAVAVHGLFGRKLPITKIRGEWMELDGVPIMPTYHPSYLLRNAALSVKREVWEDMLQVLERLGRPITSRQQGYFLSQ